MGLDEVGERDGWRCWICDVSVDPAASVNDGLGPSIDRCDVLTRPLRRGKPGPGEERLAHRSCNTGKGANDPVVPWADHLIVVDPAPIIAAAERLERKGGREAMARCPTRDDADEVAAEITEEVALHA